MRTIAGPAVLLSLLLGMGFQATDLHHPTDPPLPPDLIKGRVTAVRLDEDLVILSVGDQEGVKKGYEFAVYRKDRLVAKGVVEKVTGSWSGGRITLKKQAPEEGDLVEVGPAPVFVPPEGLEDVLTLQVKRDIVEADLVLLGTVKELGPGPSEWSGDAIAYQPVVYRIGEILRGRISLKELAVHHRVLQGADDARPDRPGLSPAYYKEDRQFLVYGKFKPSGEKPCRYQYGFVGSRGPAEERMLGAVRELLNGQ